MLNSHASHNAVRADRIGNDRNRANNRNRQSSALKFFRDRCAATITASSGGNQNYGVNARLFELFD